MIRRALLRSWLATPLLGRFPVGRPGAMAAGANAADLYRRGFAWATGLAPDRRDWLRDHAAGAPIEAARALLAEASPALRALRAAAGVEGCDWGIETLRDGDLGRGHLDILAVQPLIGVACLSARALAHAGRGRAALDDLFAALALAHRVGAGGAFFARILEASGEFQAFRTLGRFLPSLDEDTRADLARRLDALAAPEPASATIEPEARYVRGAIRARLAGLGPTLGLANIAGLGFDAEASAALLALTDGDRGRLLAHLDASGPAFADLARRLDLPHPAAGPALDEFERTERGRWPILVGVVDAARGARHVVDRMIALRAMIRAGLALVEGGEVAFQQIPDPFGAGPLQLERGDDRVILIRSALPVGERSPLVLQVGEAPPAG